MDKVLVNSDKYNGQYVAMKSAEDSSIVGTGNTPEKALIEAGKKGFDHPFLIYVPEEGMVHIYRVD